MKNILEKIADRAKARVEERKQIVPLSQIAFEALLRCKKPESFPFELALRESSLSFICEVKKASPSKGVIDEEFNYLQIAKDYEKIGATAISVLTEPDFFLGDDKYLQEIKEVVSVPVLRKDFIVDPYQIYEAKALGADAVLLISGLLRQDLLNEFVAIAHKIGLSVLVETHNETEIQKAIVAGARIIGVNNRNLKTMEVNIDTSIQLRVFVPKDIIYIAESGISNATDIQRLRNCGVDGVLVGETLMASKDKECRLKELRGEG